MTTIGIIGGTGLYSIEGLTNVEELNVETPYGKPSSKITVGELNGAKLLFLARHGECHVLLPSEVNYRANICALKMLGAEWCLSISAVGSLREEIAPGHLVIPEQFIDRTKDRDATFFGGGIVAHVSFAEPFCPVLRSALFDAASAVTKKHNTTTHNGGTYVCMEGPMFSTKAESHLYRSWGASIIGMTNLTEAKLAREAEIAYATLALSTDYDCWREETEAVEVADILAIIHKNTELGKEVIKEVVPALTKLTPSKLASEALKHAIVTAPDKVSQEVKLRLMPIAGKYLG